MKMNRILCMPCHLLLQAMALIFFFFILPLYSAAQTKKQEEEKELLYLLTNVFRLPQPSATAVKEETDTSRKEPYSSATLEKALQKLQSSYYFTSSYGDELHLEADYFHVPDYTSLIKDLTFTAALTASKQNLIDTAATRQHKEEWNATAITAPVVLVQGDKADEVTQVKGLLTVAYPQQYYSVSFTPAEVGQTKTVNGKKVTLLSLTNNVAVIQTTATVHSVLTLTGLNEAGNVLKENESGRMPLLVYKALNTQGVLTPEKAKEVLRDPLVQALMANPNAISTAIDEVEYCNVLGSIAQLRIDIPGDMIEKTLAITAPVKPDFEKGNYTITYPRYENVSPLAFYTPTAALQKEIKVAIDTVNVYEEEAPGVVVKLPLYKNSAYALIAMEKVRLFKAGREVLFDAVSEDLDRETMLYTYRPDVAGKRPPFYQQISGQVVINYPVKIITRKYMREGPASDKIRFQSDYAIACKESDAALELHVSAGNMTGKIFPVRAYDADGNPLKRETGYTSSADGYAVYHYWGKVAYVEVDEAAEWTTLTIPFKLTAPAVKE